MSTSQPSVSTESTFLTQRLLSLDAYRGLIMVALAFGGFGLANTATLHLKTTPDSAFWKALQYQFTHVEWVGCAFWDLIQPSFMFMVGVSMAYSYATRLNRGDSQLSMFGHALRRGLILIFLGIFLISNGADSTRWSLMNVLTQIGLGYPFLFLFWRRHQLVQLSAALAILLLTWLLYFYYPTAGIDLEQGNESVGITAEWAKEHLTGVPAQWHKNANIGQAIDVVILNWLPRRKPFEFDQGGYQTINFLPSLATMLFGLMCGELLRSATLSWKKIAILVFAGAAGLAVGLLLDHKDVCPIVKRIWTPSWALFSTGCCCLILAALFAVIDVAQWRAWAYPLVVVGVNSIAIYCMGQLLRPWAQRTFETHFGPNVFHWLGEAYQPFLEMTLPGLLFWFFCWLMYRQRIFVRI